MEPLCDTCGKRAKMHLHMVKGQKPKRLPKIYCKKCYVPYCSDECLKQERVCIAPDLDACVNAYMRDSGLMSRPQLPSYNGRSYVMLPGPIDGQVPHGMRPFTDPDAAALRDNILMEATKEIMQRVPSEQQNQYIQQQNLFVRQYYYVFDIIDYRRVTAQLSDQQKAQILTLFERGANRV